MSVWHWWQWIVVALIALNVVMSIAKDGEMTKRDGKCSIIGATMWIWLLWMGGFWS